MDQTSPQQAGRIDPEERPSAIAFLGERWKLAAERITRARNQKSSGGRFVSTMREKFLPPHLKFGQIRNRVLAELSGRSDSVPDHVVLPLDVEEDGADLDRNQHSKYGLETSVQRSSHFILDGRQKDFLAGIINMRIPPVRIYTSHAADSLTRAYKADALTYGDRILFRTGKFKPRNPEGIALLGHELTHAAQSKLENQADAGSIPSHLSEYQELQALLQERKILTHFANTSTRPISTRNSTSAAQVKEPTSHIVQHQNLIPQRKTSLIQRQQTQVSTSWPKAAPEDRQLGSSRPSADSPCASAITECQMRLIKEEVYQDLLDRIRTEFERGG